MTAKTPGRSLLWPLIVFLLFVALFLALAADQFYQAVDAHTSGSPIPGGGRTTGTIISVNNYCGRSCTYAPIISYTVSGQTYTFTGTVRDGRPRVGGSDPVSFDRSNPGVARDLGGGNARWIADTALGAAFAGLGLGGVYLLVTAPRRRARRAKEETANGPAPDDDPYQYGDQAGSDP